MPSHNVASLAKRLRHITQANCEYIDPEVHQRGNGSQKQIIYKQATLERCYSNV